MRQNHFLKAAAAVAALGASLTTFTAQAENTDRASAEAACQKSAVIMCENWEDGDWDGWSSYNVGDSMNQGGYRGGLTSGNGDMLLPYPGYKNSRAAALKLPKDATDAIYPKGVFNETVAPNETLYARWRAYWSPGFHFNEQNTKHFYLIPSAARGNLDYRIGMFVRAAEKGGDPTVAVPYFHVYKEQVEIAPGSWQDKIGESDVRYFANQPGGENFRIKGGKWYEIEMRVTPNPTGQKFGGRLQLWIDGKLIADHSDNVSVRPASQSRPFDGVWMSTYFGGGGQKTHPEQYVLYDDIVVSRQRIGSGSGGSGAAPAKPAELRVE